MISIRKLFFTLIAVFCFSLPVFAQETTQNNEKYVNVYGTINSINYTPENMMISIKPESEPRDEIKFTITDKTIFANTRFMNTITFGEIKEGDQIMAAYKKEPVSDTAVVPSIEKEKTADVIVLLNAVTNKPHVKVDCFDKDYVSSDGGLKLNLSAKTDIMDETGKLLTEYDVPDKGSIVFYHYSDRGGRIETSPNKIICFEYAPITAEPAEPTAESPTEPTTENPAAYEQKQAEDLSSAFEKVQFIHINEDKYMKVRDLAELFGYEVLWDDSVKTATLTKGDDHYKITVNENVYLFNEKAETAQVIPVIFENYMYVVDSFARLLAK